MRAEQGFAHANIPDAIKRFEKLLKAHPELEDLLQLRLGEQALKVKQYDTAAKAFSAIDKRSWRGSRQRSARLGVLRAHYGAKRYKERVKRSATIGVCSRCMDGQTDEVLLMEAHLELLEGKRSKARALLTDLADRFPDRAGGLKPTSSSNNTFQARRRRSSASCGASGTRQVEKATAGLLMSYEKLQTSYAKRPRLLLEVNIALGRQLRRVDPVEGVALLDRLLDAMEDNHPRRDALMAAQDGAPLASDGSPKQRTTILNKPGRPRARPFGCSACSTQHGVSLEQVNMPMQGIFTWLITQKHVDRETKEKARWYAAWSLFRAQRYAEALNALIAWRAHAHAGHPRRPTGLDALRSPPATSRKACFGSRSCAIAGRTRSTGCGWRRCRRSVRAHPTDSVKDAERRSPKAAPRPSCAWRSPPIWGLQSGRAARLCAGAPPSTELALQWGDALRAQVRTTLPF